MANGRSRRQESATSREQTRPRDRKGPRDPQPGAAVKGQGSRVSATAAAPSVGAQPAGHVPPRRAERRAELVKDRRQERRRQYERSRRNWIMTKIGFGVLGVLIVGALGFLLVNYVRTRDENRAPTGVREFAYENNQHIAEPMTYSEVPPVGGPHYDLWQNCGYYAAPIPSENALHSLEHGAVWVTYRPDLPQAQVDKLRELADDESYLLVSPFPDLPAPIVASAWNRQLPIESGDADDMQLKRFINYFQRGPQAPEPNASCTGGSSQALG